MGDPRGQHGLWIDSFNTNLMSVTNMLSVQALLRQVGPQTGSQNEGVGSREEDRLIGQPLLMKGECLEKGANLTF